MLKMFNQFRPKFQLIKNVVQSVKLRGILKLAYFTHGVQTPDTCGTILRGVKIGYSLYQTNCSLTRTLGFLKAL